MEGLSEHDQAVIKTIFDPLQTTALNESNSNKNEETEEREIQNETLSPEVLNILKKAISCAEGKDFKGCFQYFDEALKVSPDSPSILNDRAQALRLAGRDDEALKDLNLAVKLSKGKGRAGVQALCQRGILHRCMNMDSEAKEDFKLAAMRGSSFATSQLVEFDPYAITSNAVLEELTGFSK